MPAPAAQGELFATAPVQPGTVVVNDRVVVLTSLGRRAVCVAGVVVHHYAVDDRLAEAYAMVMLVDQRYADQNDVAGAFGCTARTVRRYQTRFSVGGLSALGRLAGRPRGQSSVTDLGRTLDKTILHLKGKGESNRTIATILHLDEKAIRKRLLRLGVTPCAVQRALFPDPGQAVPHDAPPSKPARSSSKVTGVGEASPATSMDRDPLDRSLDRLFAACGLLDDAAPLFAPASNVPHAGVLLAIPSLVESGVLSVAAEVYGSLGPAFYGLRTTITVFVLFALLRIKRPEGVKEHAHVELGRIVGLDRAPEVKTLRRKLARFAAEGGAERFGRELAQHRVAMRGRALGFLYVDGHVRVYHGARKIPKAYVTQMRISLPATTDYYLNDQRGDPLFIVTAQANAALTKMLTVVLKEVRTLVGRRRVTVVFDRGGFSPKLFAKLIPAGFDILTYRKGRVRPIPVARFVRHEARMDGHTVRYLLDDRPVRFLKGKLRLRQVTRLTNNDTHQTPIITSRWDISPAVVAYRMFGRWRQENFFKYMRAEFAIDALVDYDVEPDDPTRMVPNPEWRRADKELRRAREIVHELAQAYGEAAADNQEGQRRTMRGFKIAHGKLGKELREARLRVAELKRTRDTIPRRVPIAEAVKNVPVVKLATERKHLTNVLKLVAYQIESDLVQLLRPHYARMEDEGRTLIQTALQGAASIEPSHDELRVVLAPLSPPHRSRAIASLCEELDKLKATFPGTNLRMRYSVAPHPAAGDP
ncbi:MAG: hypothetical protein HYZ53_11300 [Planctomycetes bacterium]|nr:hypothetical protein [Planctomycetota bacterium]